MPRQPRNLSNADATNAQKGHRALPLRVLILEEKTQTTRVLAQCGTAATVNLTTVHSSADARQYFQKQEVDLLIVEATTSQENALELVRELRTACPTAQSVVVASDTRVETVIQALRLGATDFLLKPVRATALSDCLRRVEARRQARLRTRGKARRLRTLCRELNQARRQVNEQVDTLCSDLVVAYQELAAQMNHVVQNSEFAGVIRQELDLEELIRKTLQYLLDKAGPTNAALFLPSGGDEYTLGGYVNYELGAQSPDLLLSHLADVLAHRVAQGNEVLQVTDNDALRQWLGDDSAYLADSHVVAFAAKHKEETLAVMVLFRDSGQPFDPAMIDVCRAVAGSLGAHLARIIRVHHRKLAA